MIPNFRTFLSESVWVDIHKHSNGDIKRKEENINLLDFKGLKEYILDNYDVDDDDYIVQLLKKGLYIIITEFDGSEITFEYMNENNNKTILLSDNTEYEIPLAVDKLRDICYIQKIALKYKNGFQKKFLQITPKKGKIDNKFFIFILDTIISFLDADQTYIYKHKS